LVTYYLGAILLIFSFFTIFIGVNFYFTQEIYFIEWDIITVLGSSLVITLLFDWMSFLFSGFVALISSIVLFYRTQYMDGDKYFYRFIILVFLFVLSMVLLIFSPNLISLLLGWDGLGLVSYCLVIYYQNVKSANAGMVTILSNRVGDVAILLAISWVANFGSWNFFYLQYLYTSYDLAIVLVLVILAAITKRAQIPFSAWLPAAIAAPTPVSALVHSSTLVTAGVYLLIRFNVLLGVRNFLFYAGVFTMFISGLGANFETDLKKIIALSTLSQLGLIIMSLSLGFYELSFFHLLAHALFKSLLFLCAGVFIHSMGDIQDIRHLGGLIVSCPVTSFYFIGSSLALCGFPFLSGFYSKDLILEVYFSLSINMTIFIFIFLATIFTLTYSVRLVYYLFFNNLGGLKFINLGEASTILYPMRLLFFCSVSAGSLLRWTYFPSLVIMLPFLVRVLVLISLIFLSFLVFIIRASKQIRAIGGINKYIYYLGSMWFLPGLTTIFFIPTIKLGGRIIKSFDQGWLEYIGGQGINLSLTRATSKIDYFYYLDLRAYLLGFFFIIFFVFMIICLYSLNRAWHWRCWGNRFIFKQKVIKVIILICAVKMYRFIIN